MGLVKPPEPLRLPSHGGCSPSRRPDRPVPPLAGTAAIGAVVQLLANAIEEGPGLSLMSGVLAGTAYRLLAWQRGRPVASADAG